MNVGRLLNEQRRRTGGVQKHDERDDLVLVACLLSLSLA